MTNKKKSEEKIGLFGGTFDPIHIGHTIIAEWILNYLKLNKIIFIPNKIHPFSKRENIIPAKMRAEMLDMAIKDFPFFEMDTIEIDRPGISYAVDTIRKMIADYPQIKFFYIMGEDNLNKFSLWKESDEILNLVTVVTFRRKNSGNNALSQKCLDKMLRLETPYFDLSSTDVRERIKRNQNFQSLLYPEVYRYIVKNNLYKQ